MKYRILAAASFFIFIFIRQIYTDEQFGLNLVHPFSNELITIAGRPLFVVGKISPSGSKLTVNGVEAEVDEDGAFICAAPVIVLNQLENSIYKGKFVFSIRKNNKELDIEKFIRVRLPAQTSSDDQLMIDTSWGVNPKSDVILQKGEIVNVEIKATPGCMGYFTVDGIPGNFPLVETEYINSFFLPDAVFGRGFSSKGDIIKGIYKGHFLINKDLEGSKININLVHPKLGRLKYIAGGTVTSRNSMMNSVVQIKFDENLVTGRYGPGEGYKLFLLEGTKLEINGKEGSWLRGKLNSNETVYIPESSIEYLKKGTPPPNSSIRLIRTKDHEKHVTVELGLSERLPIDVKQVSNNKLELYIYNVTSNIDWIFYDRKSNFIDEIKYSQPKDGLLKVDINLNQRTHWGYKPYYDGSILKLKINKPAKRNSSFLFWDNQLEGRIIVLDPGHTADFGSTGPRGTREKDVNFGITLKLKEMLESGGAIVYLTHKQNEDLPLRQRKTKVNSFNPEICISIHNNAVPQGVNPVIHNGSSVYYYLPQALPLSKMIHNNFLHYLGLKDFGLYWDNLYMCRISESISLLVEPAFMIIPEQERKLNTDNFQEEIAEAIFDALEKFYKEYSE